MNSLQIIRSEIQSLKHPSNSKIKAIMLDLPVGDKTVQRSLLKCTDEGIIKSMVNQSKKPFGFDAVIKRHSYNITGWKNQDREIIKVCKYISGISDKEPDMHSLNHLSYINTSKSVYHKIILTLKHRLQNTWHSLNQLPPRINGLKSSFINTLSVIILAIVFIIAAINWRSPSLTQVKTPVIINEYHSSGTEIRKIIQGRYLGEVYNNNKMKKFALIIETAGQNIYSCTMIDYPHFNHPKIDFSIEKTTESDYLSQYGMLHFNGDSLILLPQRSVSGSEKWLFSKRNY